jgi:hypothetical protein
VKIMDRVKTYFRKDKGEDPSSTDHPLDEAAVPAPAQEDTATPEHRDDTTPAVSTAPEAPEPEPAPEPATDLITEPVAEPVIEPVIDSATEPATESATEPASEPVAELATEPASEPITEPVTEPTTEPVTESAPEPTTEPVISAKGLAACPRCGATGDAPCTTPAGKATKNHKGRQI